MNAEPEVELFLRWEREMSWPYRLAFDALCDPYRKRIAWTLAAVTLAGWIGYTLGKDAA